MKAINLVPADRRRRASAAGHSGGAAYVLLGGLAVLVAIAVAWALLGRQADTARSEIGATEAQAQAAEAGASSLSSFTAFAALRDRRVQTVGQIAGARVDWDHALRELARVAPAGVSFTALTASASPGATSAGAASAAGLRSAVDAPALELTGCTKSQDAVATTISALRRIDGVQRVTLESSVDGVGASAGGTGAGDAQVGCGERPAFAMTVFLDAPASTPMTVSTP